MAHTLKISDGTTTIDFRGSNFVILQDGWAPRRAQRLRSGLGGPPYGDVVETMEIGIKGDDAADVLSELATLNELMDQVERWALNEPVNAVYLEYEPPGSGLGGSVKAAIVGPPGSGDFIRLPNSTDIGISAGNMLGRLGDPIVLSFTRRGLFLVAEEQQSEGASTANNPGLMTVTYGSAAELPSPAKLALSLQNDLAPDSPALLLLAKSTSFMDFEEGENGVYDDGDWADAADTNASNGNVARYTPNDTNVGEITFTVTLDSSSRRFAVVANLKNRSTTISYKIRANLHAAYSPWYTIDTSDQGPQLFTFDVIKASRSVVSLQIQVQADGTGSSANSLDIDTVAIVAVDDDVGRVIALPDLSTIGTLTIDPGPLTLVSPSVSDGTLGRPYKGDAYLSQIGTGFAAVLIGNTGSNWRLRDNVTSALIPVGMTVTRREGYLAPL